MRSRHGGRDAGCSAFQLKSCLTVASLLACLRDGSFLETSQWLTTTRLAGLPAMRYHDLRQEAASLMAAQGVPARVAMEVLGHAQISTAIDIYAQIATEFQKEASERVAPALWPGL